MTTQTEALMLALEALEGYTSVVQSTYDPNSWSTGITDAGNPARKAIKAIKIALNEKTDSQKLKEHGFERRPTWKSLPPEEESLANHIPDTKQMVAQPVPSCPECVFGVCHCKAQPEQEPVGKVVDCNELGYPIVHFGQALFIGTLLYTTPPQRKEQVAHHQEPSIHAARSHVETYLPTTPMQPEQEPVAYIKAAELNELKHCNGMSLWAENAAIHTDDSISKQLLPSGHVPVYTTPPQRKTPKAGDGSELFYEAVRLLDNAIFAQSGDVVRHDSAAHREALDFFNHVFTRLDLTPPPQRKPLNREEANALMTEAGYGAASAEELAHFFNGLRHGEAAHGIKE